MDRSMRSARDEEQRGSGEKAVHRFTQMDTDQICFISVDLWTQSRLCLHQFNCVDGSASRVYLRHHDAGRYRNETDVSHPDVLLRDALDGAPAAGGMRVGSSPNDR